MFSGNRGIDCWVFGYVHVCNFFAKTRKGEVAVVTKLRTEGALTNEDYNIQLHDTKDKQDHFYSTEYVYDMHDVIYV